MLLHERQALDLMLNILPGLSSFRFLTVLVCVLCTLIAAVVAFEENPKEN